MYSPPFLEYMHTPPPPVSLRTLSLHFFHLPSFSLCAPYSVSFQFISVWVSVCLCIFGGGRVVLLG